MPSMFRPRVLAAGLCLATAVALAAAAVLRPAPAGAQAGDDSVALAEVMLTRLNEVRRDNGLAPYRVNPILTRIAFEHARDIAAHTMYSHTGSDGRKAKQRAIDAGYGAGRAGLRIARGAQRGPRRPTTPLRGMGLPPLSRRARGMRRYLDDGVPTAPSPRGQTVRRTRGSHPAVAA